MDNAEDDDLGVGMIDAEMSSPIPEDALSDIVDVDMGDGGHDDATPGDDLAELEETKRTTYFHNITQDGVHHIVQLTNAHSDCDPDADLPDLLSEDDDEDDMPALVTDEDEDGIEVVYVSQSRLFMYLNEYMKR